MSQVNRNICNRCMILFDSAAEHVKHMHRSTKHHLCGPCNNEKDFPTFAEYKQHLYEHHIGCMACGWMAPSAIGLSQHSMSVHNMCPTCNVTFGTVHERNGHCQMRRPRSVGCVGCDRDFTSLSAAFNHLESSNCESGITREQIEEFAREYLTQHEMDRLSCPKCDREFNRMCDLMQHAETPGCQDGYWKGSGTVGQLVEHILSRVRALLPPKPAPIGSADTGPSS